ncbi:hypothetical protein [Tuberibacillus calidus]|jgi:hypothetical protein|uniref:hypothetical protein n=1 Tax=Tuberibacillus calidus TaxID=340097 RepID=UPI0003F89F62|nr:hypothetical protein [Tuberibacillus calidus]
MYYYGSDYGTPYPFDYYPYSYPQQEPFDVYRQPPQWQSIERRLTQLERQNERQDREINQLQRRLQRVNQRLRQVERRLSIPFTPFDGEY